MAAPTNLTIANVTAHALAFVKGNSTLLSAEELRIAQTVNDYVNNFYPWQWAIVAGTDISLVSGTQEYTMAAADQTRVHSITEAWMVTGTTDIIPLVVYDSPPVYTTDTTGRPFALSKINETQVRLFPTPDATYNLEWRFHTAGTVFTANTETYNAPVRFDQAVKAGVIWQFLEFLDDGRSEMWKGMFFNSLELLKRNEMRRYHKYKEG